MIIENIVKKENYEVYFKDFSIEVDQNTLIKFNLYKGKDFLGSIDELKNSVLYELEYKKALEFIKKPKSTYEVRNYLSNYKDEIIKRMKEEYLLNDELYANNLKIKLENKKFGKNYIIEELKKVKISDSIINSLEFLHEKENAKYYIDKTNFKTSTRMETNKLKIKLIQKGFNTELIDELLSTIDIDDSDNIKKEYEKALKKYSNCSDFERKNKIIKYLLQHGYSYDLIKSIISL